MVKKTTGKTISLPVGIALGILVSLVVTLIGAAIISWLVAGERMSEGSIGYASMVIHVLAAAAGALAAAGAVKAKRLLVCMVTGAGYFLLQLACTALFFDGQYQAVWLGALMIMIGCGGVALLGLKGRKTAKRKLKIPAYR